MTGRDPGQNRGEMPHKPVKQKALRAITHHDAERAQAAVLEPTARQVLAWLAKVSSRNPVQEPSTDQM